MPEKANECVVDDHFFSKKDIGSTIKVSDENTQAEKDALKYSEYKITGIVNSPYYLMKEERGTTSLGDGSIRAFIYAPLDGFTSEYYTEVFVTSEKQGFVFSDEYYANMKKTEPAVKKVAQERMQIRYQEIVSEAEQQIDHMPTPSPSTSTARVRLTKTTPTSSKITAITRSATPKADSKNWLKYPGDTKESSAMTTQALTKVWVILKSPSRGMLVWMVYRIFAPFSSIYSCSPPSSRGCTADSSAGAGSSSTAMSTGSCGGVSGLYFPVIWR